MPKSSNLNAKKIYLTDKPANLAGKSYIMLDYNDGGSQEIGNRFFLFWHINSLIYILLLIYSLCVYLCGLVCWQCCTHSCVSIIIYSFCHNSVPGCTWYYVQTMYTDECISCDLARHCAVAKLWVSLCRQLTIYDNLFPSCFMRMQYCDKGS